MARGKPPTLIDVGTRFGHLVVVDNTLRKRSGRNNLCACLCKCDCGNYDLIANAELLRGHSKSCGCRNGVLKTPHETVKGQSGERLYKCWAGMRKRCFMPNDSGYKNYGGRGITVCDEWANDYQAFKTWALSHGYADDLTLDRIDVNGNYEPDNCRWATKIEQGNNRRTNRYITFNGETRTIVEWARKLGVNKESLEWRFLNGWSTERALTEPYKQLRRSQT